MTSIVRKIRRAVIRADLDRLSKANHAADIIEEVYKQGQEWKAICAEQGAMLERMASALSDLGEKHNTLVAYLKQRGHLSNDEGLVTLPGSSIVLPKGTDVDEILKSVGR